MMQNSKNPFETDKSALIGYEKELPMENKKEVPPQRFNPYVFNGGNIAVVQGEDYVVCAGDTRLSLGYGVLARDTTKICRLTDTCVLCASGMYADFIALCKYMKAKIVMYEFDNGKKPSTESCAQLLGTTLYGKRFFPYYCFCAVTGITKEGKGVCYGYDAIGSFQPAKSGAQGSASQFMTPAMDQIFDGYNNTKHEKINNPEKVRDVLRDCFNAAAERDIHTGDGVEILIITKDGIKEHKYGLRKD
mmetsp:Transcript_7641/g.10664  ORF Transcript_7641/g.10664 Transcript_7641/m.10664 type:complete len:247 (-) Transcript_7641:26-766(-)